MKKSEAEKQEAKEALLRLLKPGQIVYTVLRHVSSSGMRREIDCFAMDKKGGPPVYLSGYIAQLMGWRRSTAKTHWALIVDGYGMDMGFHAVYALSCVLFGRKAGGCQGAKALRHEWL